jgi:hypothetical protein
MIMLDKILPDDPPFMNPAWSMMKFLQFRFIPMIYWVYFITVYLYKKMGCAKYFIMVATFWLTIYALIYSKMKRSCLGRGWTLENYYHWNKPFFPDKYQNIEPTTTVLYDKSEKIKPTCTLTRPTTCWHYMASGWENLFIGKDDKNCGSKIFMDRLRYTAAKGTLTDIENQVVAIPNIDTSPENKENIFVGKIMAKQV